ncbi:transcriptional regulator [Candidatus Roizmanbacteria bacterium CG11_big_fil_rev_8_21_14_0_20_37_16]|uniref:Transcriptional regulator n=1 Tax=Candidatus Roizmanbacteria bacterium CG11_big_fil_rev_8_21_14_0_20_37_16 TaxID=1974857 RepID=A0A2H0KJH2_9BACT|nr:MAG: transcriptional regulator [Candidatus Roizmanbacteria bacterium CG11_big_fil_rev_8_21_14_0_20_37_16]
MSTYRNLKNRLLKNKNIRKEYELLRPEYEMLNKIISLRIKNNLTQQDLANKLNTKQSAISRLERGMINPTMTFLNKLASVFGKKLVIKFR